MKSDTLELIELIAKALKGYVAAMGDGKIDLNDAAQLLTIWPAVLPAINGIANVPTELAAMPAEDRAAFETRIREAVDFNGTSEQLELFCEELLLFINRGFALLSVGRVLFAKK